MAPCATTTSTLPTFVSNFQTTCHLKKVPWLNLFQWVFTLLAAPTLQRVIVLLSLVLVLLVYYVLLLPRLLVLAMLLSLIWCHRALSLQRAIALILKSYFNVPILVSPIWITHVVWQLPFSRLKSLPMLWLIAPVQRPASKCQYCFLKTVVRSYWLVWDLLFKPCRSLRFLHGRWISKASSVIVT